MYFLKRTLPIILLFLAGMTLWRINHNFFWGVDSTVFGMSEGLPNFFPVAHGITNAYHMWRLDPVIGLGTQGFGVGGRAGAWLFTMGLGIGLLLWAMKVPKISCYIFGILGPLLVTALVGFDVVVLGSLAWVPLLGAIIVLTLHGTANTEKFISLFVVSLLLALSANQLALPIAILLVGFTWAYSERLYLRDRYIILSLILLPSLISAFLIPAPPFEKYPPFSHFVPGYGTKEGSFGLIGPEIQIPVIDLGVLRDSMFWPGLCLTFFAIFLFLFTRNNSSEVESLKLRPWLWSLLVFGISIVLSSSIWSSAYSQMSPLPAVGRLSPGLSLIPIGPTVFAAGVIIGILILCIKFFGPVLNSLGVLALVITAFFQPERPLIWDNSSLRNLKNVEPGVHSEILVSPSLYLLRNLGFQIMKTKGMEKSGKFVDLLPTEATLFASREGAELKNLVDKDSTTRARLAAAPQSGDEWLLIRFNNKRDLSGIRLRNDNFFSDFPRGLEVKVATECTGEVPEFSLFKTVSFFPEWQGAIRFSRSGLPYYGPQGEVEVIFPRESGIQCLMVRQTFPEQIFDWSVTEIEIAG